ncbi:MAG TPA: type II secretion system protein [Tepidisphaeraceae bacterium]|jgi:prepilin-type N-terminal cleavage/methylation domain-containing protein/prepilin-type processing-associated H-X9-DG protein|nr:type II secretion system protein [Tepidisphaeraceae bacterium]
MKNGTPARRNGFTLTELMVVVGLIAVMISLLFPALGKARSAANSTACLSNLRQMGTAWTMYVTENRGRLPDFIWNTPTNPDLSWQGYWLGILDNYHVKDDALLCPAAREAMPNKQPNKGFGTNNYAWNGNFQAAGCGAKLNAATYRIGSYGYNRYLTAGGGFGSDGKANRINAVRQICEVPVFLDAVFSDFAPINGTPAAPALVPPNLQWDVSNPTTVPDQFRFLIARHGRGVNVFMADGSARWVALEDTYLFRWKTSWAKYRLMLPAY